MSTAAQAPAPAQAIEALPYVRAIAPYQAGKPIEELAREHGLQPDNIVKLASNENPLGMPASARAAIDGALAELGRYPDSNGFELKAALSRKLGVPVDWITLGNGSNDILEGAAAVMLAPGRSCVYAQHSFAVYPLATMARGARSIVVPARDFGHDLGAMLAAIDADTRLVFVANPNNPTGTFVGADRMAEFLGRVPPRVVVVLDEAYNEYLPLEFKYDSVKWLKRFPNLVVVRTFSKAYGLAGLRVGYSLSHPALADLLNRVRQPFNVNSVAQAAAVAALGVALADQQGQQRVARQRVVVVEVLVAQRQTVDPLTQQIHHGVLYLIRLSTVLETGREALHDPTAPIHLTQQRKTTIRADPTAVERSHHLPPTWTLKQVLLSATVCSQRLLLFVLLK